MPQISRETALALCGQAERGDPNAQAALNRAEVNGEIASIIDPIAGAGFRSGTGTIVKTSVFRNGHILKTEMLFDLTGLASSTTDLDVIGVGTNPAYMLQWTARRNGLVPFAGTLKCLEVPVGGVTDIDLYYATLGTGKFDDIVTGITGNTALITAGGAWTLALEKAIADPASMLNKYLYLTCGAAGTPATYTAGKFLLTLLGYDS